MFEKQIAAGMAWLDANKPGWATLIDLKKLDLQVSCRCVLGLVFGEYDDVVYYREEPLGYEAALRMGFTIAMEGRTQAMWSALDEEWIAAIRQRQDKVEPARDTRPAAGMALTAICLR